jgi:rhamnulokinase
MAERAYAAVDLGAESGRVVVGRWNGRRVSLDVVHRFPNRPVHLPDGIHWNLLHLFSETLQGLCAAEALAPLDGVGVDAWGVDYALLDEHKRVLGLPFHYRDARTDGMIERAHSRVPREELYRATGIQTIPINTIYQLLADEGSRALGAADRIALTPDLFNLWLTGELANESTIASTTGLLDAARGVWAVDLVDRLGLPRGPFEGTPVEPGTALGDVLAHHELSSRIPVYTVASHDTASAYAAAPLNSPGAAILSSGTWSLLGLELDAPVLTPEAAAFNLTNERGIDGTTRLLSNVMGLWLVQECRRQWETTGGPAGYDELHRLAASAPADVPLFDPDMDAFLAPGDMPARIASACEGSGQRVPATPGETVRSILLSLACKYRLVLERLERVSRRQVDTIQVVGGGSRNTLLCQFTADVTNRRVIAGPIEATALGNVLVQARATGEISSLADLRAATAASADVTTYEPSEDRTVGETTYERFLAATSQAAGTASPAAA